MRKTVAISSVALAVMWGLCGCSGGGGGGGGGDDSSPAPHHAEDCQPITTNQYGQLSAGEQWNYSSSGYYTYPGSGETAPITGSMIIQIMNDTKTDPLNNVVCLDWWRDETYSIGGTQLQAAHHFYQQQLSDGTLLIYGINRGTGDAWITTPSSGYFIREQSPVTLNQTLSASMTLTDGSTYTYSGTIAPSTVNISVPAGNYETYLLNAEVTETFGTTEEVENFQWYIVPSFGLVREVINSTTYVSGVSQGTVYIVNVLTSSNAPD